MSYGRVSSYAVIKACERTITWIANDRKHEMYMIDEHNKLVSEYPWYLRWLCGSKWTGEWVKHLHWTQERTCCKIYKLAKESSWIYISADDAEAIGLHNIDYKGMV